LFGLLGEAEVNLAAAKEVLNAVLDGTTQISRTKDEPLDGKVVEGIFDGQVMVGPDGKSYPVPANYASKSKLVEGDLMKLTIETNGSFIYKQIGPVARRQVIGKLISHDGGYFVETEGREYRILLASVTFFKIKLGDNVSAQIPEDNREAEWAAVEAVL
jgi:hypothetical protein